MRGIGLRPGLFATSLAAWLAASPLASAEHRVRGIFDVRLLHSDSRLVWLDGGLDKGRFSSEDEPLAVGAIVGEYRGRWTRILDACVTLVAYDDVDQVVDVTEAFLELRPVPRSAWRWRIRGGAFYPPVSLENTDVGWTSPYTLSFSAINNWIGEEIRTLGLEAGVTRQGHFSGSAHDLGLTAGLFRANDPAGALVSWRGWALGDRQTGLFSRLPLPPLPGFEPGGSFPPQDPFEEPFVEIDDRTGYYVGAQWDYLDRSRLRALHYDNLGDPSIVEDGQWSWRTRFDALGWHVRPTRRLDVLAQFLRGDTLMVGRRGVLVFADYESAFVLASHSWSRHRLSLRFDLFDVVDRDATADDPNRDDGHGWTAAYFLTPIAAEPGRRWSLRLGVEVRSLESERPARLLLAEPAERREQSLEVSAQLRW